MWQIATHSTSVPALVVLVGAMLAAITDLRSFKIYNVLTFPLMITGIIFHTVDSGWEGFLGSCLGLIAAFSMLLIPYLLGAMGAGDVKLVMAFGSWLGAELGVFVVIIGLLATAAYSFAILLSQGRLKDSWVAFQVSCYQLMVMSRHFAAEGTLETETVRDVVKKKDRRRRLIPFSLMAGLGVLVAVFFTEQVRSLIASIRL